MRSNVLITIVITTHERDTFLRMALDSVMNEVLNDESIEVIVLDNASKNKNVYNLVSKYQGFKFIKNDINIGLFGNWNKAFKVAQGDYVYIMGDDDVMKEGFIKECKLIISTYSDIDIVYTDYQLIDQDGRILGKSMPSPFGMVNKDDAIAYAVNHDFGLPTISMIYNKKLFEGSGFDEVNFGSNDWIYLYMHMPWKTAFGINKKLICYRKHGTGASGISANICNISIFFLLHNLNNNKVKWSFNFIKKIYHAINSLNELERAHLEENNLYVVWFKDFISSNFSIKTFRLTMYPILSYLVKMRNSIL